MVTNNVRNDQSLNNIVPSIKTESYRRTKMQHSPFSFGSISSRFVSPSVLPHTRRIKNRTPKTAGNRAYHFPELSLITTLTRNSEKTVSPGILILEFYFYIVIIQPNLRYLFWNLNNVRDSFREAKKNQSLWRIGYPFQIAVRQLIKEFNSPITP